MVQRYLQTLSVLAILLTASLNALPLSTRSRWIVDASSGARVKLRCVSWAGHLEVMVPEGLDKQPLHDIAAKVASLGFNCVRLTWATYMAKPENRRLTVLKSFESLGLRSAINGIHKNNPSLLHLTLPEAQDAVVDELGKNGLMVVLDNYVSKPMWCCSDNDGNGFFGDKYFDPREWLQGLRYVAAKYKRKSQVVAMSLRNELRGPKQNELDWHRYMQEGAKIISKVNPNLLVIASGLSYDSTLGFLRNLSLRIDLPHKLVYEVHRYAFTHRYSSAPGQRQTWRIRSSNRLCGNLKNQFEDQAGFLRHSSINPVPLFVSEFGVDQSGLNEAENMFLTCFLSIVAEKDLDWALWALQGSYYLKNGKMGSEEIYGVLDSTWTKPRDRDFKIHYGLIMSMTLDPRSNSLPYYILYHPLTGGCAQVENRYEVSIGNCRRRSHWSYDKQSGRILQIHSGPKSRCLRGMKDGYPVILSGECSFPDSNWTMLSNSRLHIGVKYRETSPRWCLDWNQTYHHDITSRRSVCLDGNDVTCSSDPRTQWFSLVPTNVHEQSYKPM